MYRGKKDNKVDIRKYSKEWFTLNKTETQRDGISGLEQGYNKPDCRLGKSIDKSIFIGSLDDVKENVANMKSNMRGAPTANYYNIEAYGAENIFKALDADGDGIVTEKEVNDVAALDTKEFADAENEFLSTTDLDLLYENAMKAVNASVIDTGLTKEFHYEDGEVTRLNFDNKGNLSNKNVQTVNEDGTKKSVSYSYGNNSTRTTDYDAQGRTTKIVYDEDGDRNDYTKTYTYAEDGSKTVETKNYISTVTSNYNADGTFYSKETKWNHNSNGIIDDTKQRSIGDCWVLSGVNALRDSEIGAQILKSSLQQNDDGSVTVHLRGVGKDYTFSAEEIMDHKYHTTSLAYSSGDSDMNLFEMAIGEYRKETIESGDYGKNSRNLDKTAGSNATAADPLKGGQIDEAIYYITGQKSQWVANNTETTTDMLNTMQSSANKYIMTTTFKNSDPSVTEGKIVTGHAYSINKVDDDYVYVVNPWDSSVEIPYPKDKYLENAFQVALTDLTPGLSETYISAPDPNATYTVPKEDNGSKFLNTLKKLFS